LEGYDAKAIYSGAQVLGMLDSFSPHVVLFDSELPGCDPGEVVNAARARAGKPALLAQVSSNDRVRHEHFDAHLLRPVEWPQLQALLRSRRAAS
jgi:CheY-like chemotaxis protein